MWIHVPSTSSVSVADTGASSLDSTQPWLEELARSATWKTNSVSLQSLQRVWKTVPSIRLLSGLTCEPSIQNRGAAEWISSLEASHASHTASQGTSSEETIQGNSQEKSLESPTGLDFQTSFLKMFPESSDSTGTPSDPNYERWVTHLRRDSSQRQKRAHLTSESVSSSWPTPNANEDRAENYTLETSQRHLDEGRQVHLAQVAKLMWPTPRAAVDHMGLPRQNDRGDLQAAALARNWPTPDASPRGNRAADLIVEGKNQVRRRGSGQQRGMDLETAIKNWPTPTGRDYKGFDPPGKQHTKSDPEMYLSIPQAPATTQDGHTCSPSCRRLNPRFAEMLLGLCQGWTDDSAPLATGLYQQWRRRLIESLRP